MNKRKSIFKRMVVVGSVLFIIGAGVVCFLCIFNDFNWTPTGKLMAAIEGGDAVVIRELMAKKIDVNVRRWDGDLATPLMVAARMNDLPTVKLLLDAGADPSLRDHDGNTARTWALQNSNYDIVHMLDLAISSSGKVK